MSIAKPLALAAPNESIKVVYGWGRRLYINRNGNVSRSKAKFDHEVIIDPDVSFGELAHHLFVELIQDEAETGLGYREGFGDHAFEFTLPDGHLVVPEDNVDVYDQPEHLIHDEYEKVTRVLPINGEGQFTWDLGEGWTLVLRAERVKEVQNG